MPVSRFVPLPAVLTAFLALFMPQSLDAQPCTVQLALVNGHIFTVDRTRPWAEAVSICGDRISRVGSTAEIKGEIGPATRVIDLAGRLVVPGFIDARAPGGWREDVARCGSAGCEVAAGDGRAATRARGQDPEGPVDSGRILGSRSLARARAAHP